MQDIDFDEIDRAVSSITNGAPKEDASAQPVSQPAADLETPVTPSQPPEAVETTTPAPVAPSPAARRSTGRFMDVVHPSSDMRPSASTTPSPRREEVPERTEVAKRPEPTTVSSSAFHWPDPIDVAPRAPEPPVEPVGAVAPVAESTSTFTQESQSTSTFDEPKTPDVSTVDEEQVKGQEEAATPLESPFLTDAKVEKRPLGAFSATESELPLIEDPLPVFGSPNVSSESTEAAEPTSSVEDTTTASDDIPRELHEDVLLLEAHSEHEAASVVASQPTSMPEPLSAQPDDTTPTGPTSITQQYKEQPSSAPQPSGSIFDTEAYHQALTHPAKKRSSALIIVWIVALILVGGGIGAGIYFIVLPMLG